MQVYNIPIEDSKREATMHGPPDFPMATYETRPDKNVLGHVSWHWHHEVQLCLVTAGCVHFHINEEIFRVGRGDGIFINSGCLHMIRSSGSPLDAYICLDINPKLISGFSHSVMEEKYVQPFLSPSYSVGKSLLRSVSWQNDILRGIEEIYRLFLARAAGFELDITAILLAIWKGLYVNVLTAEAAPGTPSPTSERLKVILTHIHTHYTEKITLDEIAALVHLSRNECSRFFKRTAGYGLFSYILDYRIDRSAELLRYSDQTVNQIAYQVGFNSGSYFIECFRRRLGCTPKEYRQRHAAV